MTMLSARRGLLADDEYPWVLSDPDATSRTAEVASALVECAGRLVRREGSASAPDDAADWRLAAALLLARWGDPGAEPRLARLLGDDPALRDGALWRSYGANGGAAGE